MYIVRHLTIRKGVDKTIRKIVFYDKLDALRYVYELRSHETLILFKECQRREERRQHGA